LVFMLSPRQQVDRRAVLKWAAAGGGLVLCAAWWPRSGAAQEAPPAAGSSRTGASAGAKSESDAARLVTAWVSIALDGSVTLIASQSEMGQGTTTTLAAALADELYLPWDRVRIEFAPFDPAYRDPVYHWMFTGNSQSITSFYEVMRRMGAAAREMLISAAAARLGVDARSLSVATGAVHAADGRSVRFGEIAGAGTRSPPPGSCVCGPARAALGHSVEGGWQRGVRDRCENSRHAARRSALRSALRCPPLTLRRGGAAQQTRRGCRRRSAERIGGRGAHVLAGPSGARVCRPHLER